jgi:hypothetical protein
MLIMPYSSWIVIALRSPPPSSESLLKLEAGNEEATRVDTLSLKGW